MESIGSGSSSSDNECCILSKACDVMLSRWSSAARWRTALRLGPLLDSDGYGVELRHQRLPG
jgi:hypothetical protein